MIDLLVQDVDVYAPTATTDDYNDTAFSYGEPTTCKGWIHTLALSEYDDGRNADIYDAILFLATATVIDTDYAVGFEGRMYRVVGGVHEVSTPQGPHHLEVKLKAVAG